MGGRGTEEMNFLEKSGGGDVTFLVFAYYKGRKV